MKWGSSKESLVAGLCIGFVDSDWTLLTLLWCNKQFYETLREKAYKQALLHTKGFMSWEKRTYIWSHLLKIHEFKLDYEALRKKINENVSLIKSVDDVIILDV